MKFQSLLHWHFQELGYAACRLADNKSRSYTSFVQSLLWWDSLCLSVNCVLNRNTSGRVSFIDHSGGKKIPKQHKNQTKQKEEKIQTDHFIHMETALKYLNYAFLFNMKFCKVDDGDLQYFFKLSSRTMWFAWLTLSDFCNRHHGYNN